MRLAAVRGTRLSLIIVVVYACRSIIPSVPLLCFVRNHNDSDVQQLSPRLISLRGQSGIFGSPELEHIPLNYHLFL